MLEENHDIVWKYYTVECAKDFNSERAIIPILALSEDHAKNVFEATYGCEGWLLISVS